MENKALQENNKEITKYLEILEKLLIKAQNNAESLKKTCKNLESENNDLLANLKTTKQIKMYIKRLSRNESENWMIKFTMFRAQTAFQLKVN